MNLEKLCMSSIQTRNHTPKFLSYIYIIIWDKESASACIWVVFLMDYGLYKALLDVPQQKKDCLYIYILI